MRLLNIIALLTVLSPTISVQAAPVSLINDGFEANWTTAAFTGSDCCVTFIYQPSGPDMGWSFGSGTGVAGSYSLLSAYEGNRFGFLQTKTEQLSQSFSLSSTASLNLDFALALRQGYSGGQEVGISVDGNQITSLSVISASWVVQHVSLGNLAAGSHTLSFAGLTPYDGFRDTTAFIDAVHLTTAPIPEPETYAMMLAGLGLLGVVARRRKQKSAA